MSDYISVYNKLKGNVRSFDQLVGRILCKVEADDVEMRLYLSPDNYVRFYHEQDCCESVYIEDICGDLADLVDAEILFAEEVSGETPVSDSNGYEPDSCTWTFYRFQTTKGSVDVRWYGESNGYYSESVDVEVVYSGMEGEYHET